MSIQWGTPDNGHDHESLWIPPARCGICGHRVGSPGYRPIETRRFPVWYWPFELINRWQARLVKYLPPEFILGTEEISNDCGHNGA